MTWLRWIATAIAVLMGCWMTFDGTRALIKGDYVTPRDGPYAGQLGPWAGLLRGAGLDPRAAAVKATFIVIGLGWLTMAIGHALGAPWARSGLLVLSVLSIWYLPVGTVLAIVELAILLVLRSKGS